MWSPREVRVFLARHFYQGVKRLIFQSSQSYNFPGAVNLALTISTNEQCEEVAAAPSNNLTERMMATQIATAIATITNGISWRRFRSIG